MVSVSDIVRQVEPAVGRMSKQMVDKFKDNLLIVFKTEAAAAVKSTVLKTYDQLADLEESQMGPRVRGKDPLSLKKLRPLFASQITLELENNIRIEGDQLVLQVMEKSKLGFGRQSAPEGTPDSVDVLSYYLEGIIGNFAYITKEHYAMRQGREVPSGGLGRAGAGFLISEERYKSERWREETGIPFEDVRHSISGQRPFSGFRNALQKLDFSPYIKKALENTKKSFDSKRVG